MVSIPHWFDSKMSNCRASKGDWTVSIPHWFDSKMSNCRASKGDWTVSIPHWFDSKFRTYTHLVSDNQVSIPHWFDSKMSNCRASKGDWTVSIPHWFDSKSLAGLGFLCCHVFQFHIGSIQRRLDRRGIIAAALVSIPHWFDSKVSGPPDFEVSQSGFNSTLVRFKGEQPPEYYCWEHLFQFHIGSIQSW